MAVTTFDQDAVQAAFWASVLFLLGYSIAAPWWRHPIGRGFASLDAGLAFALSPAMLHDYFGLNVQNQFFAWYDGAALCLVALITLTRLGIILRVQRSATPRHGTRRDLAVVPSPDEPTTD